MRLYKRAIIRISSLAARIRCWEASLWVLLLRLQKPVMLQTDTDLSFRVVWLRLLREYRGHMCSIMMALHYIVLEVEIGRGRRVTSFGDVLLQASHLLMNRLIRPFMILLLVVIVYLHREYSLQRHLMGMNRDWTGKSMRINLCLIS